MARTARRIGSVPLLAIAGVACAGTTDSRATPNGALRFSPLSSPYFELADRLPAWVDRANCLPRVPGPLDDPAPEFVAGLECVGRSDDVFSSVVYDQVSDTTGLLRPLESAGLVDSPSCLEGPWHGLWDIDGEVVGWLACDPYLGELRFTWTDVQSGIVAWASFREGIDYPTAYRFWRTKLTDMR